MNDIESVDMTNSKCANMFGAIVNVIEQLMTMVQVPVEYKMKS